MKLTELIETLNKLQSEHGDREVFFYDSLEEHTSRVTGRAWTGNASDVKEEFYDAGDSDVDRSEIDADIPVLVIQ